MSRDEPGAKLSVHLVPQQVHSGVHRCMLSNAGPKGEYSDPTELLQGVSGHISLENGRLNGSNTEFEPKPTSEIHNTHWHSTGPEKSCSRDLNSSLYLILPNLFPHRICFSTESNGIVHSGQSLWNRADETSSP